MVFPNNVELADKYDAVINNPAVQKVCSWHRKIYANEVRDNTSEEELLERARENISSLARRLKQ